MIFCSTFQLFVPCKPCSSHDYAYISEPPTNVAELTHVVSCLGIHRSGDNFGHAAELWKDSPDDFLNLLLHVMTQVLKRGNVPPSCQITFKGVSDCRPFANVCLVSKRVACLMFGCIVVKGKNMTLTAVDVIFVVSVKNVYSAVVCLVHCWKWHCPHGVQKMKAQKNKLLKMSSIPCWIYDLAMTY